VANSPGGRIETHGDPGQEKELRPLTVRDFYRRVRHEYADPRSHPITAEALAVQARVVNEWVKHRQPGRILDLGCGPAPVVPAGAAALVVRADLVLEMLRSPGRAGTHPAVCLNAETLPFRGRSFDFVWCGLLVDHIARVRDWLQELFRVLAPGGTLGLACWDRSVLPEEKYPQDSQMLYQTSNGEQLLVPSYPNWPETLELLREIAPGMTLESFPIVPGSYVLQIAAAQAAPGDQAGDTIARKF